MIGQDITLGEHRAQLLFSLLVAMMEATHGGALWEIHEHTQVAEQAAMGMDLTCAL